VARRLLGSALRGRFWIFTTGWSVQSLPQPQKLIDHNADADITNSVTMTAVPTRLSSPVAIAGRLLSQFDEMGLL
jgi:hypothetical protein